MNAARALAFASLLALVGASGANAHSSSDFDGHHRQVLRVVVVHGVTIADLPVLASAGAVGLVVPNAGPRTSAHDAFAGMVRSILHNSRLPDPRGAIVLIRVRSARTPSLLTPEIVVGLPPAKTVANDRRHPIVVIGRGFPPGAVLRSSPTRVPGLVSMAAVARTAFQAAHALRAAYTLTMALEPSVLLLAPIGPKLTSRFFGISNQLEMLLLAPALLGAWLVSRRFGIAAFAAVAALSLVTIAENRLGADGGEAVVVGVGFAVVAVAMAGGGRRLVVPALGAAALAVLLVDDSPGAVLVAALGAVLALDGGLVHRTLALPLLRRLARTEAAVRAARPQE